MTVMVGGTSALTDHSPSSRSQEPESKRRRTSHEAQGEIGGESSQVNSHNPFGTALASADADAVKKFEPKQKVMGYDWYHNVLGSPKYICAPMVDQSELPFRLLCLDYGADLCYTPMINSKMFLAGGQKIQEREFYTDAREKGKVIAQFCGDDPNTVFSAASLVESQVDGVDLNCGCPQGIARRGHYGSYLLEEPDVICGIIGKLARDLKHVPATCKIRKVNNSNTYQETIRLCERLVEEGVSAIAIHGRVKEEKGQHTKAADWEVVRIIKERIKTIPIFCNGGIETYSDVIECFKSTKCDAVMSSEALLEDPQLFAPLKFGAAYRRKTQDEVMRQYLNYASEFANCRPKTMKSHGFHFLYAGLQVCTDLRTEMGKAQSYDDISTVCTKLQEQRIADTSIPQLGWYRRYRKEGKDPSTMAPAAAAQEKNDNNSSSDAVRSDATTVSGKDVIHPSNEVGEDGNPSASTSQEG